MDWRGRLAGLRATLPPPADELAVGPLLGGVALALGNAVAIELAVPWPGLGVRLAHHGFALLEVMGVSAWLALPAVAAGRLRRAPWWLAWLLLVALGIAGMGALLGPHLEQQASRCVAGPWAGALRATLLLAVGLAPAAAQLVGVLAARLSPPGAAVALAIALAAMIVNHAIWRDDYPAIHTAIAWPSAALFGAVLAPRALGWLGRRRRRRRSLVVAATLLGVAAVLFAPPNAVRLQLFREPGAAAAWVLARLLWRPPAVPVAPMVLAEPVPLAKPAWERARAGLPARPVVVLVTVEAMRGDVLADRRNDHRFPVLSRLREEGAWLPNALAPGSQTSVTLTSMFTSRYFSQLRWLPYGEDKGRFLYAATDPSPRFPELLTLAGVHTESFIGLRFIAGRFGVARGFAREQVLVEGRVHALAATLLEPLLAALRRIGRDRPALLYVHLMEPHEPYDRGGHEGGSAFERYLAEIEVVDHWLGRLRAALRRRFPGQAYLVLSADHGEAFGEHGSWQHTKTLYEELVRVPLVFWGPGIAAGERSERAGLIDVGPTLLHLFGVPTPATMMGQSLLPLLRGQPARLDRALLCEGRLSRALYTPRGIKVIEDTLRRTVEAYDLTRDPGERDNLFDRDRDRVAPAVSALRAIFARHALRERGYEPPFKP